MSFQAMSWAVSQKTENAGQKLVLLMLANHTNGHTGQCNPSHKLLADECCMGLSTLKNHISALEALGFLEVIHKSYENVSLPNQYILKLDGVGQNLTEGQPDSGWGGSKIDRRVGQNLATKQEVKPVKETVIKPSAAKNSPLVDLPDWIPLENWNAFIENRKQLKKPATEKAIKLLIAKLETFKNQGHNIAEILDQSTISGWSGVFLVNKASKQNSGSQHQDQIRAFMERHGVRN